MMNRLTELIINWMNEKDSRSVAKLAKISEISQSTIRRILSQECDPSESTVRSILRAISDIDTALEILQSLYPGSGKDLELFHKFCGNQKVMESAVNELINGDLLDFELLVMTVGPHGYCQEKAYRIFGERGRMRIDSYLDSGVMVIKGDRLYISDYLVMSAKSLATSVEKSAKLVKKNIENTPVILSEINRYTQKERERIKHALINLSETIKEIHKEQRPKDGAPTYIGFVMGVTQNDSQIER